MPLRCSGFSLKCLQALFSLSIFNDEPETDNWSSTRSEVSKIAIMVLMTRCECILNRFLVDENDLGDRPLPTARLTEVSFVLHELAHMVIHADTASIIPICPHLKTGLAEGNPKKRSHLLLLFPTLCELVVSRETRVRELVQVLLKLIAKELTL
ncbi:protein MON2 homolog [Hibiscus syriacus]|uniref:protein MON2 homolog n=1 Tax=Hibiscus syriacus TaxID=106335 RepID=UPI0019208E1D|nr:protein MON2 homolog [Hibiscus syriacus]